MKVKTLSVEKSQMDLINKVNRIAQEILRPAASEVDRDARFPFEALDAMRQERLLAAYIPEEYGGLGCKVSDLVVIAESLARSCASSAMIWAMHQSQLACIVHHGISSLTFQEYLKEMAANQLLLGSITSEVDVGGDIGTSIAAVEKNGSFARLEKKAPVISYGEFADAYLATARRTPNAAGNDQVLVLLRREQIKLEKTGEWNTLGMRGTCSPSFHVSAVFPVEQILPISFQEICSQTMAPMSHILWSACWLGIAADAVARAQLYVKATARRNIAKGTTENTQLVEATNLLHLMRNNLLETVREYENLLLEREISTSELSSIGFTLKINTLKITSSQLAIQIVNQALSICGMAGYTNDSPYSVGRHLRDVYSAGLMINNTRLYKTNAALLLIHKNQ